MNVLNVLLLFLILHQQLFFSSNYIIQSVNTGLPMNMWMFNCCFISSVAFSMLQMLGLVLLSCAMTACLAKESNLDTQWEAWKERYNKMYPDPPVEYIRYIVVFSENASKLTAILLFLYFALLSCERCFVSICIHVCSAYLL